jgi:hypothetical protein
LFSCDPSRIRFLHAGGLANVRCMENALEWMKMGTSHLSLFRKTELSCICDTACHDPVLLVFVYNP